MKINELLEYGKSNLIDKEKANRLSKILLKYLLKVEDSYLVINSKENISQEIEEQFKKNIDILNFGKPIQYITHNQEFMKLNFYVDENVLIPQPDTEILVEEVLSICDNKDLNYNILDMCTGSGAIGISVAKYIQNSKVLMADISNKALKIAEKNTIKNDVKNKCKFIKSDMFVNIKEKFDIIVSNPPYIKSSVIKTLDKEVQNEPLLALDGGEDGLEIYRRIINEAYEYLNSDGYLCLEIGYDQKDEIVDLIKNSNRYTVTYCKKDLSGNDRIIVSKKLSKSIEYSGKIWYHK